MGEILRKDDHFFNDEATDIKCGEIFRNNIGQLYYVCTNCWEKFQYLLEYEEHIIQHDLEPVPVDRKTNKTIENDFSNVGAIKTEASLEQETSRTTKHQTEEKFPCIGLKHRHRMTSNKTINCYNCDLCPSYYESVAELSEHVQRHDQNNTVVCSHCNELLDSQSDLDMHLLPVVKKKKPRSALTEKYTRKSRRRPKSVTTATSTDEFMPLFTSFQCDICSRKFALLVNLENHLKRHANNTLYPKCDQCGRQFTQKKNLIEHIQRHNGDKRIKCDVCGKLFFRDSYLRIHMRTHSGERPCQCSLCGKTFKSRSSLLQHTRIHDKQTVGTYKCSQCNRSFFNSTRLAEHVRSTHTFETPFTCDICGRAFSRQKCWKEHVQIHNGKQFPCNYCGILFSQGSGRRRHEKLMHNAPKKSAGGGSLQ